MMTSGIVSNFANAKINSLQFDEADIQTKQSLKFNFDNSGRQNITFSHIQNISHNSFRVKFK